MTENIWLDKNVLRSTAFRSLNRWSLLIYLDFLRKRQMEKVKHPKKSDAWIIRNNGEIVYPYVEAEHRGIGRREFRNGIDELMAKGFIDIAHQGSGGRAGDMTKYSVSERWKAYGTSGFQPPPKRREKDTRQGRGWSVYHAKNDNASVAKTLPEKAVSSDKTAIPIKRLKKVSSNTSAIPKRESHGGTVENHEAKWQPRQLGLWSDKSVTIL